MTDAEWALIEPHLPPAKRGVRRREFNVYEVLQGVLYVQETGCHWRHLSKDFPPRSTVWEYFDLWRYDGTLDCIHETLYLALPGSAGREASPTAGIVDSHTAKSAEMGPSRQETRFDAGNKTEGIKRHILVDMLGLMLRIVIHPAGIQDRDGAALPRSPRRARTGRR